MGMVESAFHLALTCKDKTATVTACIEGIKNMAYLFERETVSLSIIELMESKLIYPLSNIGKTGFEILEEIQAYYEGID